MVDQEISKPNQSRLVDNEHTLLTETDLVFIDPVGLDTAVLVKRVRMKTSSMLKETLNHLLSLSNSTSQRIIDGYPQVLSW